MAWSSKTASGGKTSVIYINEVGTDPSFDTIKDINKATAIDLDNASNEIELKKPTRISGNLVVIGALTSIEATDLQIADHSVQISTGNTANLIDSSFYATYNDGTQKYSGLGRNHADGKWTVFNTTTKPSSTTDFSSLGDFKCGSLTATSTNGVYSNYNTTTGDMQIIATTPYAAPSGTNQHTRDVTCGPLCMDSSINNLKYCTAMGWGCANQLANGSYNTLIGYAQLNSAATANSVTAIGANICAGLSKVYTDCTFVGKDATSNDANHTNSTAVGKGAAITADNQVVLGNASTTSLMLGTAASLTTTQFGNLSSFKAPLYANYYIDDSSRATTLALSVIGTFYTIASWTNGDASGITQASNTSFTCPARTYQVNVVLSITGACSTHDAEIIAAIYKAGVITHGKATHQTIDDYEEIIVISFIVTCAANESLDVRLSSNKTDTTACLLYCQFSAVSID